MKKILLISLIIFLGTSCSKNEPISLPTGGGTNGGGTTGGGTTGGGTGTGSSVLPFPQGEKVGSLSSARADMASAICNNKFLFAGGYNNQFVPSTDVDIFDPATNTIQTAQLSMARNNIIGVASGNKAFFAGGCGNGWLNPVSRIDIYDAVTNTWSMAELSIARHHMAVGAIGDKVFFAGGITNYPAVTSRVDITILQLTTGQLPNLANPGEILLRQL